MILDPCDPCSSVANSLLQLALTEDIGSGDITTNACVPADRQANRRLPDPRANHLSRHASPRPKSTAKISIRIHRQDGETLPANIAIATVKGRARKFLECERTALNFLQRLSGIATSRAPIRPGQSSPHQLPHSRYAKDHTRLSPTRKSSSESRRSHQPPHGPLRCNPY